MKTLAITVAMLGLLAGILAAVLPYGSHGTSRGRPAEASSPVTPVTPVTDLSGVRWTGFHGYRLPVSAMAGPRVTAGDLASGFADTPLGALLAPKGKRASTSQQQPRPAWTRP